MHTLCVISCYEPSVLPREMRQAFVYLFDFLVAMISTLKC